MSVLCKYFTNTMNTYDINCTETKINISHNTRLFFYKYSDMFINKPSAGRGMFSFRKKIVF